MTTKPHRILALGAHTDDIELGCGATLARIRRTEPRARLALVAFSRAEKSLPVGAAPDTLEQEFQNSIKHLGGGIEASVLRIPVRDFPDHRQAILEELIRIRQDFNPDLILTHSSSDTHQDHEVVSQESVRAFRGRNLLGYEIPWNQTATTTNFFVEVEQTDLDVKCAMLNEYSSQVTLARGYMDQEYVRGAAAFRGRQSRSRFAEAFELIYGKASL